MRVETTAHCPNCLRLQAQLEVLQAQLETQQAQLETQQAQLETQQAQLETQQAQLETQQAQLETLKTALAQLQAQLAAARKDSSTSSKPPSSDIVKPPKPPLPEGQDRRRIGGQPGHPKHERVAFPPEAVDAGTFDHRLDSCPSCGHDLRPALTIPPRVVQQVDIVEVPL